MEKPKDVVTSMHIWNSYLMVLSKLNSSLYIYLLLQQTSLPFVILHNQVKWEEEALLSI